MTAAECKPPEQYFIRTLGLPAAFRLIEALTRPWYARRRLHAGQKRSRHPRYTP